MVDSKITNITDIDGVYGFQWQCVVNPGYSIGTETCMKDGRFDVSGFGGSGDSRC